MTTILDKILATKREEVAAAKARVSPADISSQARDAAPAKDFIERLKTGPGRVRLIAEVKKASPSAGLIREDFNPVEIASIYAKSGASCISVLTDEVYFKGHLDFLKRIRAEVDIPLLRKDFIIDRYQIDEARAAGADCVLLIAECLTPSELVELYQSARELGMASLIELYDPENLPAVLATGCELIGVNNRDLRTFVTDLDHTIRMRKQIPANHLLVGESGIRTHADVQRLADANVNAMLVGESLMRQDCLESAVKSLLFGSDSWR